jgi:uncharacterized low-complexity protein
MGRLFVSLALTTSLVLAVNLAVLTPTVTHAQPVEIKTITSLAQELVTGVKTDITTIIEEICGEYQCTPTTTTTQTTNIVCMDGQCTPFGSIIRCESGECITTDLSAEEICPDGRCILTATSAQSTQQSIIQECVNGQCSCSKTTCVDGQCGEESC